MDFIFPSGGICAILGSYVNRGKGGIQGGYDCDKDCLEDLQVFFTSTQQPIVDQAISVKARKVEVLNVYLAVEPVPFNKGFYSVDMTFFFQVSLSCYTSPLSPSVPVEGLATFSKKVILYGSEGNVKVYTSDQSRSDDCRVNNMPKASVQVSAHPMPFLPGSTSLGGGVSPPFGGILR